MRIATGCISHESSTFTNVETSYESFIECFGDVRGAAILKKFRGANTPTGGFIEGAEAHGFELVPTIMAVAHPSGPAPRSALDRLINEMLAGFQAAAPIDGVLLELHGAMVAEGIDDGEGYILSAVRVALGCGGSFGWRGGFFGGEERRGGEDWGCEAEDGEEAGFHGKNHG